MRVAIAETQGSGRLGTGASGSGLLRVVTLALLAVIAQTAAAGYVVTSLPGAGGTQAFDINNTGQVAGSSFLGDWRSTRWAGGSATDLGTLGGPSGYGFGLNDAGQVVGYYNAAVGGPWRAALWSGDTATDLGTLGGAYSIAYGINGAGLIVGESTTSGEAARRATLWAGGTATDLGSLGGSTSAAIRINESGLIAGYSYLAGDVNYHATLWTGGLATDLGTLGGGSSSARAVNAAGQIVGSSQTAGDAWRATLWSGGVASDLGGPGVVSSFATDINDAGQVVGWSYMAGDPIAHPMLWADGLAIDLNEWLPGDDQAAGWVFDSLGGDVSINNLGQVVIGAVNQFTVLPRTYVLTPLIDPSGMPEPSGAALTAIAIGVLVARRRRKVSSRCV